MTICWTMIVSYGLFQWQLVFSQERFLFESGTHFTSDAPLELIEGIVRK